MRRSVRMAEPSLRPADSDQAERLHTFAHDIKNRFGALWEALRLLKDGPVEGMDGSELMSFAERGFFSAQRDLEQLLDDFGVDRTVQAERVPFDLIACVNGALRNEEYRLGKKDQHVVVSGLSEASAVGDARWTGQIVQALISNASKFSSRGAEIRVHIEDGAGMRTVRVADSGCGLSAEDLLNVFTRYSILSSRSTDGEPQSRGTLGRAKQWAEAQGGTLSAESQGTGKGCVFTLELPC